MTGPSRASTALASTLAVVAGLVDGTGFLHLGGSFVSFMSGNSTRLGIGLAAFNEPMVVESLTVIAIFVVGALLGSLVVGRGSTGRRRVLLLVEAALLGGAALADRFGYGASAVTLVVLAMGAENTFFQQPAGGNQPLTYITGALVKVGQGLAGALTGGERWAWLPNLLLWASLTLGAVAGAWLYARIGLADLWIPSAICLVLIPVIGRMAPTPT